MTFQDLPSDWPSRPITDPAIFCDVIDLVVTERNRHLGALTLLLCDDRARLVQPFAVEQLPRRPSRQDRRALLYPFAQGMAGWPLRGSLVVAVARRGRPAPEPGDLAWVDAAQTVCRRYDLDLLAAAIATPHGIHRLADGEVLPSVAHAS